MHPQAYQYFKAGAQYIVRDGQVVIVDESTGRVKPISRYQVRARRTDCASGVSNLSNALKMRCGRRLFCAHSHPKNPQPNRPTDRPASTRQSRRRKGWM